MYFDVGVDTGTASYREFWYVDRYVNYCVVRIGKLMD